MHQVKQLPSLMFKHSQLVNYYFSLHVWILEEVSVVPHDELSV